MKNNLKYQVTIVNLFLISNLFDLFYSYLMRAYFTNMTLCSQLIFYNKYFYNYLMYLQYFKCEYLTHKFIALRLVKI